MTQGETVDDSALEEMGGEGALHKGNLIYLPFARHLAQVDEAEEGALKVA